MELAFKIACVVLGNIAFLSFLGGFLASFRLSPYDAQLEESRREAPGFRWLPKRWPAPKKEDYPAEVRSRWVFRDRCLKTFAICFGLIAIIAVSAVALGYSVPFQ
jgi:hypothetical protein